MGKREVPFSFSWQAMQLLGKSLYSNAWSAISELVANGFDAGARTVRVLIDGRDKRCAHVEIMDDGSGMDIDEIRVYAKVGYDRRASVEADSLGGPHSIMGRKGIGKLAALYLSDDYCIQTKTRDSLSTWCIRHDDANIEAVPHLEEADGSVCTIETSAWNEVESGTIIVMNDVDLTGLGEAAFGALSMKLANQFLLSSMGDRDIKLAVRLSGADVLEFKSVQKNIAFKNMIFIAQNLSPRDNLPSDILAIMNDGQVPKMAMPGKTNELVSVSAETFDLDELGDREAPLEGFFEVGVDQLAHKEKLAFRQDVDIEGGIARIPYRLTGWLGVHASINSTIAKENDKRFVRNNFYNPAQIRLYVRNKLACEDVLSKLDITQAFANYIEGEISFDILDDDLLPDIATSSRQGFDEMEERWILMKTILRPVVRSLIRSRQNLVDDLNGKRMKRQSSAKAKAIENVGRELSRLSGVSAKERDDVKNRVAMEFQGDANLEAKENRIVFFSHSSADAHFTNFCYKLLRARGARADEFFYTSADDDFERYEKREAFSEQVKRNIMSDSALIAYFTSPYFKNSEYCLFEGGAGWATRTVDDYLILSTTYSGIPEYLTDGRPERTLANNGEIVLDRTNYHHWVSFMNGMIEHLNEGRRIGDKPEIKPFVVPDFPDDVTLGAANQTIRDYMDVQFLEFWDAYVENHEGYIIE